MCGGGSDTFLIKTALEHDCDVYITGEKVLYTIQYAQFEKIDLLIGSHTFIEFLGIENLAKNIKEQYEEVEIVKLHEEHIEV